MAFYAVLMGPRAELTESFDLRADGYRQTAGALLFLRDGRIIHQLPAAYVLRVEEHPDQRSASEAVAGARRARAGGTTIHTHEAAAPAAPRRRRGGGGAPTAIPAEGLSIRIDER